MSTALTDEELARRAAALAERLDVAPPTSWRPDDPVKGHPQMIMGVLERVEDAQTSYGPAKIAILRTPEGEDWACWILHSVLKGEFAKLRPRIGELVAIKYEGKVEPRGGGAPYEMYRVVVDREDVGADWDGLDRDEQSPEQPPAAEIAAVCAVWR